MYHGCVTAREGETVLSGVKVLLQTSDGRPVAQQFTSKDGCFTFDGVDAGSYVLSFDREPFVTRKFDTGISLQGESRWLDVEMETVHGTTQPIAGARGTAYVNGSSSPYSVPAETNVDGVCKPFVPANVPFVPANVSIKVIVENGSAFDSSAKIFESFSPSREHRHDEQLKQRNAILTGMVYVNASIVNKCPTAFVAGVSVCACPVLD
jgi:hypothetical protein